MDTLHQQRHQHDGPKTDQEKEIFPPAHDQIEKNQHRHDQGRFEQRRPAAKPPDDAREDVPGAFRRQFDLPAFVFRGQAHRHQRENERLMPRTSTSRGPEKGGQGGRTDQEQSAPDHVELAGPDQRPKENQAEPKGRGHERPGPVERVLREKPEREVEEENRIIKGRSGAGRKPFRPVLNSEMILNQPLPVKDPLHAGQLGVTVGLDRPRPHRGRMLGRVQRHPFGRFNRPQP